MLEPVADYFCIGKRHKLHAAAHVPVSHTGYWLPRTAGRVRASPMMVITEFNPGLAIGAPRVYMVPAAGFQIFIPSYPAVGLSTPSKYGRRA